MQTKIKISHWQAAEAIAVSANAHVTKLWLTSRSNISSTRLLPVSTHYHIHIYNNNMTHSLFNIVRRSKDQIDNADC